MTILRWIIVFLKYIGKLIAFVLGLVILVVLYEYFTCPIYRFPEPEPFSGSNIYNPYQDLDSLNWRKANFQIQSYAWSGITDGRKNTNYAIDSVYKMLGYDIITTSDYQKINHWGSDRESYIPVYEHGYNMRKRHQVLIGARKVNWRDYLFIQTIHNKQHIIHILRKNNELVYIAHPKFMWGYQPDDMTWLTGYDGIEILGYFRVSLEHWDAALSAGHWVTALGNDDAHDLGNIRQIGHRTTFICSESLKSDSIIAALRAGRSFAADIFRPWDETFEQKVLKSRNLASLLSADMSGDTLQVRIDKPAKSFRFIGQNGSLKQTSDAGFTARYIIRPEDTYIRTEIEFPDQDIYYLNPVIRCNGQFPANPPLAEVDQLRTWVIRIIFIATLIFITINVYYLRNRFLRRKK
jgi:hypothetical protein